MYCSSGNKSVELVRVMIENGADMNMTKGKESVFQSIARQFQSNETLFSSNLFVVLLSSNLVSLSVVRSVILCFPHHSCSQLFLEYEKGPVWNKDRHFLFPPLFNSLLLCFISCLKVFFKKNHLLVPKPVLFIIFRYFSLV